MTGVEFKTKDGLIIEESQEVLDFSKGLSHLLDKIDNCQGAIFSSGFDYPGRHSRWEIGFVNPAIELKSKADKFFINALNDQGSALLAEIADSIANHPHFKDVNISRGGLLSITGSFAEQNDFFTEEERSKQPSVFSLLRLFNEIFGSDLSHFGLYGAFGYDLIFQFEKFNLNHKRDEDQPDCHLFLPLDLTVIDRMKETSIRYQYSVLTKAGRTGDFAQNNSTYDLVPGEGSTEIVCDHQPGEFAKKVEKVKEGTRVGDYFEIVLSQSFSTKLTVTPTQLFNKLCTVNPSPYLFLINLGKEQLVGSSPEIYIRVTGKRYETCPISGTVPRGANAIEDADRVRELILSKKEESELTMCTDVDRNDMARVCVPGSVKVIGRRQLEFYSHLIHTVDHLEGELAEGFDSFDAFQTHMWACTVSGSPKPAAVREIERLENSPRKWYAGAVGFLNFNGDINTGITLRTAHLKDGRATIRAGATLLYECDPVAEETETRTKAAAFLSTIAELSKPKVKETQVIKVAKARPKLLLVDCYDSFIHNLAAYLREVGCDVTTVRTGFPLELLSKIKPDVVLLSPGPASPKDYGVPDLVGELVRLKQPCFGVCLGHQGIGEHFGATLNVLPFPVHGKPSTIEHYNSPIFKGVSNPFQAGRYHSLYLEEGTFPEDLEIIARTIDNEGQKSGVPMAICHKRFPVAGVQFHPESMLTLKGEAGRLIVRNLIDHLLS